MVYYQSGKVNIQTGVEDTSGLYICKLDGSQNQLLIKGDQDWFRWAPDSRHFIYLVEGERIPRYQKIGLVTYQPLLKDFLEAHPDVTINDVFRKWLDENNFLLLYRTTDTGTVEFWVGNVRGESYHVLTVPDVSSFDVFWVKEPTGH